MTSISATNPAVNRPAGDNLGPMVGLGARNEAILYGSIAGAIGSLGGATIGGGLTGPAGRLGHGLAIGAAVGLIGGAAIGGLVGAGSGAVHGAAATAGVAVLRPESEDGFKWAGAAGAATVAGGASLVGSLALRGKGSALAKQVARAGIEKANNTVPAAVTKLVAETAAAPTGRQFASKALSSATGTAVGAGAMGYWAASSTLDAAE